MAIRTNRSIDLLYGAMLLVMVAPVIAALYLADTTATANEFARTSGYARDALNRSEVTTRQIDAGMNRIEAMAVPPCSPAAIAEMRAIDLGSSYVQAVGYVVNGRIVCSSLGTDALPFDLGPADIVQPGGAVLRANVVFPFAPEHRFIVVERRGLAAIIHKSLPLDSTLDVPDASLALMTVDGDTILSARGTIKPAWRRRLLDPTVTTFIDDSHIVAIARSQRFRIATIAAVPKTHLQSGLWRTAFTLLPIALAAAALLALGMLRLLREHSSLPATIRHGLRHREFHLLYQPIVDLRTSAWTGAEVLIRWQPRHGDPIGPDVFIPVAEQSGLIKDITRRVCELVIPDARAVFAENPNFRIGINLSSDDMHDPATVDLIQGLITASGARPGNLLVEATERCLTDAETARPILNALKCRGVRVAIDDFGTGYSGLAMLETLGLDALKVDKRFVDAVGTDSANSRVISHVIAMAQSLELDIVAEGVESEIQADFLRAHGVQYGQGFLFGPPMSIEQLLNELRRRTVLPAQQEAPSAALNDAA